MTISPCSPTVQHHDFCENLAAVTAEHVNATWSQWVVPPRPPEAAVQTLSKAYSPDTITELRDSLDKSYYSNSMLRAIEAVQASVTIWMATAIPRSTGYERLAAAGWTLSNAIVLRSMTKIDQLLFDYNLRQKYATTACLAELTQGNQDQSEIQKKMEKAAVGQYSEGRD